MATGTNNVVRGPRAIAWYLRFARDTVNCAIQAHRRFGTHLVMGDILYGFSGLRNNLYTFGPQFNRQVIGNPQLFRSVGLYMKGPRGSAQRLLRAGVTRMLGDEHREQRRLMMPMLKKRAVEQTCGQMVRLTADYLDELSARVGQTLNANAAMRALTLRLVGTILFGWNDPRIALDLYDHMQRWLDRNFTFGNIIPLSIPPLPYWLLIREAERLRQRFDRLCDQKRRAQTNGHDIITALVHAFDDGQMNDRDLYGQLVFMFNASFETTTTAVSWTLYLLAQHPSVYADLHDEVSSVLGDGEPTIEAFERMPLLDRVLRESMRICPPVPMVARVAQEATELEGAKLNKNDRVFCSYYITHHLPQLYDRPQRFDPSRWQTCKPGPYDYLPFGAGSHVCIGYDFAMQQLKVMVSMLVQRVRFAVVPNARIDRKCTSIMGFKHGLPMTLHKQDRQFSPAVRVRGGVNQMIELDTGK